VTITFADVRKETCSSALVAAYGKSPNYKNIRVHNCDRQNLSAVAVGKVHECRTSELPRWRRLVCKNTCDPQTT